MLDPKKMLEVAMKKVNQQDKKAILKDMLEELAEFVDTHDILVPELSVSFKGVELSLTMKKLEEPNAKKTTGV